MDDPEQVYVDRIEDDYFRVIGTADGEPDLIEIETSESPDGPFTAGSWFGISDLATRLSDGTVAKLEDEQ